MSRIIMTQESPKVLQRLRLENGGKYSAPVWLTYEHSIPEGVSIEEPEFQFFAHLILKGWEGPKLLTEFAELALEGSIPSELSHQKLSIWLSWFATEVTFGY